MSSPRRDAALLLIAGFVQDFALRLAMVAIPLLVLAQTHNVAATGIVGGVAGIPSLLAPWWTRRARQWVDSGARLALVGAAQAVAFGMLPLSAVLHLMHPAGLAVIDLLIGIFETLAIPGTAALLADVGDRIGPEQAVTMLTWQDGLRRVTQLVGPAVGAIAVAAGGTTGVLLLVTAVLLVTSLAAVPVPATRHTESADADPHPTIRSCLRGRPEVVRGWVMRAVSCCTWFAFALGLAVLGSQRGEPGVFYAWGMAGYGVGSLAGTALTPRVIRSAGVVTLARLTWTVGGGAWVLMALWPTHLGVAMSAAIAGSSVVLGIAAVNRSITTTSTGTVRRTLMGGQATMVNATASLGMLAGGPIIATCGVRTTLVISGVVVALTALIAGSAGRRDSGEAAPPRTLEQSCPKPTKCAPTGAR